MARHRLAFYLHSRIEAFSLTHLLLGSVRFSPNKYSFYRNYLTRLLSIRVLSPFEKPQRTLTHCRPLAISPPRQPEGSLLTAHFPIGVSREMEGRFRLFDPSLAQFKRTYNPQGEGAPKCLSPLPRHFLPKPKQDDRSAHRARLNQEQSVQSTLLGNRLPSCGAPLLFSWTCLTCSTIVKVGPSLLCSRRGIRVVEWPGNFFPEPRRGRYPEELEK